MFDPSAALRQGMIGLSKNTKVRDVVEKAPVSKDVVKRFVAGTGTADAVSAVRELDGHGKLATLDFLGEDTLDKAQAIHTRDAYLDLLADLQEQADFIRPHDLIARLLVRHGGEALFAAGLALVWLSHITADRALEAGITFLDTAEMYPVNPAVAETYGQTEQVIGAWLADRGTRDRVRIATKISGPNGGHSRGGQGFEPGNIAAAVDGSLGRLGTDRIDLYQLHWPKRGSYAFRQNWTYDPSRASKARAQEHMEGILEALRDVVASSLAAADSVGAPTTWVLSNHDVLRHASRFGLPQGHPRPNGIGARDQRIEREWPA